MSAVITEPGIYDDPPFPDPLDPGPPEPCCATEPHLCDWSTEPQSNNPADLARVCITHEGHH